MLTTDVFERSEVGRLNLLSMQSVSHRKRACVNDTEIFPPVSGLSRYSSSNLRNAFPKRVNFSRH